MPCLWSGYVVAVEGGEHDAGTDDEEDGTDKYHDGLADIALARGHLEVYLQGTDDGDDGRYGIDEIEHIEHHRHHIVVRRGKSIRSPTVVHTAALGGSCQGREEQDACQGKLQQMDCLTAHRWYSCV